jgi:polyisoprenyl-phosphate glycosyltransferase
MEDALEGSSALRPATTGADAPVLSLVVPLYNEAKGLPWFFETVTGVLDGIGQTYEIIYVNDGSRDETLAVLIGIAMRDPRIKVIDLSRNFGKEAALTAGLDAARGDAVVPMDVDLQDPPDLLPEMVTLWQQGFDVVLAKRANRGSDALIKRLFARLYYWILKRMSNTAIPENVGDFRLMDRKVVEALKKLPERTRFMKGMFAWLGFRQTTVEFVRPARATGTSNQGAIKLLRLGLDGLISFTTLPLRIWTFLGLTVAVVSLTYMAQILIKTLIFGIETPGFATLATALFFFNGIILLNIGILGEYVARIFDEVKRRPIYLVRERINFNDQD